MAGGNAGGRCRPGSPPDDRRIEAARGYLLLDMPRHALEELAAVRNVETHRFDVARLRGEALRLLGRFREAALAYSRAIAERPQSLTARLGAAACDRELGRPDRALAAMEEANRLHPNEPAVLLALSQFSAVAGEYDRALAWLDRAARICPEVAAWAERHEDFASLTTHPRFRLIIDQARCRQVP